MTNMFSHLVSLMTLPMTLALEVDLTFIEDLSRLKEPSTDTCPIRIIYSNEIDYKLESKIENHEQIMYVFTKYIRNTAILKSKCVTDP